MRRRRGEERERGKERDRGRKRSYQPFGALSQRIPPRFNDPRDDTRHSNISYLSTIKNTIPLSTPLRFTLPSCSRFLCSPLVSLCFGYNNGINAANDFPSNETIPQSCYWYCYEWRGNLVDMLNLFSLFFIYLSPSLLFGGLFSSAFLFYNIMIVT